MGALEERTDRDLAGATNPLKVLFVKQSTPASFYSSPEEEQKWQEHLASLLQ